MENLDIATLTALAKLLDKEAKKRREDLEPGEHIIDETVELTVSGKVKVSRDEEYTPTTSIPTKLAMALFVRYSGCTGPRALDALMRAMAEAVRINELEGHDKKRAIDAINEVTMLEEAEEKVQAQLEELPKATRTGKVNVKARVA